MGWGGDHTAWALQVAALAEEFDVIAFDNRGAGQSDAPDVTYSMVDMAEDVTGLMDELGVRRAHVIGASMGGMVAQELALRHPDRVLSLQLHCTAAHVDEWGRAVIDNFLRAKGHGNVEEFTLFVLPRLLCRKTFTERRDFVEMWIQRALEYPFQTTLVGLNRQAQAIRGHDTRDGLATLRMPTLITTGTEDILVPPSASDDLHERIAGSRFLSESLTASSRRRCWVAGLSMAAKPAGSLLARSTA
jgi:pimeloyl-ACP methyl ester carboxylesterase